MQAQRLPGDTTSEKSKSLWLHLTPGDIELLKNQAKARGFSQPSRYIMTLVKKDAKKSESAQQQEKNLERQKKGPETLEERQLRLVRESAQIKLELLGQQKYLALHGLKNHIFGGDEKKDSFLLGLDSILRNSRDRIRKKDPNFRLTTRVLNVLGEAIWDYLCRNGGVIMLDERMVGIDESDIKNFIRLGSVHSELEEVNEEIDKQRKYKRKAAILDETTRNVEPDVEARMTLEPERDLDGEEEYEESDEQSAD